LICTSCTGGTTGAAPAEVQPAAGSTGTEDDAAVQHEERHPARPATATQPPARERAAQVELARDGRDGERRARALGAVGPGAALARGVGHQPQAHDQRVAAAQQRDAAARRQLPEVTLQAGPGARQPLRHAQPERHRGLGRDAVRHHAEAVRGQREKQRRLDDVGTRQRLHVLDADRRALLDHRDHRAEEAVDRALVNGEQQLLLAGEIEVDGALGESRLVGHLGHAGDPLRPTREQALGRVEDRRVPLLLVLGLHRALPDRHQFPLRRSN
jgi:hypothetical protein